MQDTGTLTTLERVLRFGVGLTVSVLAWPADEDVRRHLSVAGQPRILLVDGSNEPPTVLDPLEDWVRLPVHRSEVEARARAVLARAQVAEAVAPQLDDDGILHVGERWVGIPPAQVPLMRLLLDNVDRVVRTDAVAAACVEGGASDLPASIRTMQSRLAARLRPLGLDLVTVRQRGVLLRWGGRV